MAKKRTTIFVDEEKWREFRSKVVEEGKSCSGVINEFIHDYLNLSKSDPSEPSFQELPDIEKEEG